MNKKYLQTKKLFVILFCTLSLLFSFSIFAEPFDMILTGDPILEDLRFLALETGIPVLSFTPPLAPAEVRNFLNKLNEDALSSSAMQAYNRVLARLEPEAPPLSITFDNFSAFFNIDAALEARLRFNDKINWQTQGQPEIAHVISIPVRLYFYDSIQLFIEPLFYKRTNTLRNDNFDLNFPLSYSEFNEYSPQRAFIAAGGSWWNFQIGRDQLYWGTGHTGSLTFNDANAYFDFARLSLFVPKFKYSVIINQLPLSYKTPNDEYQMTTQRYYYLHRLDFTLFNKLSIGIMEGLMVGNSPLEIRYLNPLVLFHSLITWNDYDKWTNGITDKNDPNYKEGDIVGSILSLEINWNITNSFAFYGQFVMNEFALPAESANNPDQPPNAMGYMAGLQYSHCFNTWASVFFLEFVYTDPYLHVLSSPFGSFIKTHHSRGKDSFIGYPRDTIAVTLGSRFFYNNKLSLTGSFSWVCKGEHDKNGLDWNWEKSYKASNKKTPVGTGEHNFILSLGADWEVINNLCIFAGITGIYSVNNGHVSGASEFGGQASLGVRYRIR